MTLDSAAPLMQRDQMGRPAIVDRPAMSEYGLLAADDGRGLFPWSWVQERMAAARNYWIGSTRPDGRPHVMPVWGVWLDDVFYFSTGVTSRKARNLAANPAIVVHLESGDDVVVMEGTAERMDDPALKSRVNAVYAPKYKMEEDVISSGPLYGLRPQVVFAWLESDFPGSATRWRFEQS
jgi:hypothetical protein